MAQDDDIDRPEPWTQQKNEGPKPYAAFAVYRDMGIQRSGRAVAEQVGKSYALIKRWATEHQWVSRARAWDAHLDAEARRAQVEARTAMFDLHARVSRQLVTKAAVRLLGNSDEGVEALDLNKLTPNELVAFIRTGVDIERISRGEATERQEHMGAGGGPIVQATVEVAMDDEYQAKFFDAIGRVRGSVEFASTAEPVSAAGEASES